MPNLFDRLIAQVRVAATTLGDAASGAGGILANLVGFGSSLSDPDAEKSASEPLFGVPGFFARPRDKDASGAAEYLAARQEDGLWPLAGRDLRITTARGPVAKGSVGFGGYGGGFVSFEDAPSGGGNIMVVYVPYNITNGKGANAHSMIFDSTPSKETITILHGKGHYVALLPDGTTSIVSPSGKVFATVSDDGIAFSGPVKAATGMTFGDPTTPGTAPLQIDASGGTWGAQVTAAITAIAAKLNAPGAVVGAPGTVPPVAAPPPTVSTKASASP